MATPELGSDALSGGGRAEYSFVSKELHVARYIVNHLFGLEGGKFQSELARIPNVYGKFVFVNTK